MGINIFKAKQKEEQRKEEPKTEVLGEETPQQIPIQIGYLAAYEEQTTNLLIAILSEIKELKEMMRQENGRNQTDK